MESLYYRFKWRIVYKILCHDEDPRMKIPTVDEVADSKADFKINNSLLNDVYCIVDGLKLYMQQAGDFVIQKEFHNVWNHDHYVRI